MKDFRDCIECGNSVNNYYAKYCSNKCQLNSQYSAYIKKWKAKEVNGSRGTNTKAISKHVIRYLQEKHKSGCSLCGWNEIHNKLGKIPLEIDHIDGDSENNSIENLRMICPNCHSLTSNYKNLNRGYGREWRRLKYLRNNAPT